MNAMRRMTVLALALLVVPGGVLAQGRGPDGDRRAELERQVRRQFMAQVAQRLELTAEQQRRVREVLADGVAARRGLALESQALRIDLMQAIRDEDTEMSRYSELLNRLAAIRARERELERREEAALAEFLDPRQQAVFLLMRMQFNDRVRQMRGPHRPGGGPGSPP